MKKVFLLIVLFASAIYVNAQKNVIIDTFEDNSYGWSETGNRKAMSYVSDGALNLKTKKATIASSSAQLPINYNEDFKVTFKIKFNKKPFTSAFDILFDVREDGSYNSIGVAYGKQYVLNVRGHEAERVKFNFGNTLDYDIQIVKKGNKIELLINDMELNTYENVKFETNVFSIISTSLSSAILSVDEIIIEQ